MGYLPKALVNYLLLLSWAPGENREIIDIDEAVKLFDLSCVNKTAATFDLKKLGWVNNQYIKNEDSAKLLEQLIPLLKEKGYIKEADFDRNYLLSLIELFKPRLGLVNDFCDWADFFFLEEVSVEPKAKEKYLSKDFSHEFCSSRTA